MSEFQNKSDVSRLLGSPPGYKNSEQGGELTNALQKTPQSVVLIEEVEKGDRNVIDLFLRILDEGCVTDALGHLTNCKEATFIFTSNLKISETTRFFRPEFLGRLSCEPIKFESHKRSAVDQICRLEVDKVKKRARGQGCDFDITPEVHEFLVDEADENPLGVRTIRTFIEKHITNPLADAILSQIDPEKRYEIGMGENGVVSVKLIES